MVNEVGGKNPIEVTALTQVEANNLCPRFGTFFGGLALFLTVFAYSTLTSRNFIEFSQGTPVNSILVNANGLLTSRDSGEFSQGLDNLTLSISAVGSVT